jgi:CBS domain containing-hemolysin-like protein
MSNSVGWAFLLVQVLFGEVCYITIRFQYSEEIALRNQRVKRGFTHFGVILHLYKVTVRR